MKFLTKLSLPVWATTVVCGLTVSAIVLGCANGPQWMSRRGDDASKTDSANSRAAGSDERPERDRFASASRSQERTEKPAEEKRGFFSNLWHRDRREEPKKTENPIAQQREYQPFETTPLAKRSKRDRHPATRDPFLEAEQTRAAAETPVGRVRINGGDTDRNSNPSMTRTVSRTVIADAEKQPAPNDNPFAALERKPQHVRTGLASRPPTPTNHSGNQFVPGFDTKLENLGNTVPQRPADSRTNTVATNPVSDDPFDLVKRKSPGHEPRIPVITDPPDQSTPVAVPERHNEAAPFPTIAIRNEKPQTPPVSNSGRDPFQPLVTKNVDPVQPPMTTPRTGTNLEEILKNSRTRVDVHGRKMASAPAVNSAFDGTKTMRTTPPPKPDVSTPPKTLSTGDRSMIVDSDHLADRAPIKNDAAWSATNSGVTPPSTPRNVIPPKQKPIEIQIIPRPRRSSATSSRGIDPEDVTQSESPRRNTTIVQVAARREIKPLNTETNHLLQWRPHPDAKLSVRTDVLADEFVAVESEKPTLSRAEFPGPFSRDDSASQTPVATGVVGERNPSSSGNNQPEKETTSRTTLWILGGLLLLVAAVFVLRRRRSFAR